MRDDHFVQGINLAVSIRNYKSLIPVSCSLIPRFSVFTISPIDLDGYGSVKDTNRPIFTYSTPVYRGWPRDPHDSFHEGLSVTLLVVPQSRKPLHKASNTME